MPVHITMQALSLRVNANYVVGKHGMQSKEIQHGLRMRRWAYSTDVVRLLPSCVQQASNVIEMGDHMHACKLKLENKKPPDTSLLLLRTALRARILPQILGAEVPVPASSFPKVPSFELIPCGASRRRLVR